MKQLVYGLFAMMLVAAVPAYGAGAAVTYTVSGIEYEGYFTGTAGAPLLLMIHDWDGINEYEIKRAEMLAELGYAVFAADLFGKGVRPAEVDERRRLTGELYADRQKMRALLQAGFEQGVVQGGDGSRAVVFGYCFGGAAVLEMARSGAPLKGFVSFHGGLSTPEGQDYRQTNGSILIFHGTADTAISMQDFAALAVELEETGIAHEMISYGGAPHAFTVFDSNNYREEADRQSWVRFVNYLKETVH